MYVCVWLGWLDNGCNQNNNLYRSIQLNSGTILHGVIDIRLLARADTAVNLVQCTARYQFEKYHPSSVVQHQLICGAIPSVFSWRSEK